MGPFVVYRVSIEELHRIWLSDEMYHASNRQIEIHAVIGKITVFDAKSVLITHPDRPHNTWFIGAVEDVPHTLENVVDAVPD